MSLIEELRAPNCHDLAASTPSQLAWLCLAYTPGIGPKTFQRIQQAQISAQKLYELDDNQLGELGITPKSRQYLRKFGPKQPHDNVLKALRWAECEHHHLVALSHPAYPYYLKQIASPPPVLMISGQLSALTFQQVAIVGSRHPTAVGRQQAYDFAFGLAELGFGIASGLAKGIDGAAHKGALDCSAVTLAVLGTGVDVIYPKEHQALAEEIKDKGAIISEFPLGTPPKPGHFPRRNRIVSGLALGTLVVEATIKSGSLITTRQTLEQNRQVFAIPGPISNPQKSGCHYLIRQGAVLVENPTQIAEDLLPMMALPTMCETTHKEVVSIKRERPVSRDPVEQQLLKALDYEGASVDTLVERSSLDVATVNGLVMMFELKGWLRHEHGLYSLL